jgi:hypothetical protein
MSGWLHTFVAVKTKGGLSFGAARPFFDRVVSSLGDETEVVVTLAEKQDKRTSAQNRLIWGTVYSQILEGIGESVGYDRHDKAGKEQLHLGLLMLYSGTIVEPLTKREVPKVRSSKMTKAEFSDYVEWVARWAAQEHGVAIALPGELP